MVKKWPTVQTETTKPVVQEPWQKRYPLHASCEGCDVSSLQDIINTTPQDELSSIVNLLDDQGWAPIHYACFVGSAPIAEILCANGVALDKRIPNGSTPLHIAAGADYPEVVNIIAKYISQQDKSFFTLLNEEKQTPIALCKAIGSPNMISCIEIIEKYSS